MITAQIDDVTTLAEAAFSAPIEIILAVTLFFLVLMVGGMIVNLSRMTAALTKKIEADAVQTEAIRTMTGDLRSAAGASSRAADTSLATREEVARIGKRMDKWEAQQRRLLLSELRAIYTETLEMEQRVLALTDPARVDEVKREFERHKMKIKDTARLLVPEKKDLSG